MEKCEDCLIRKFGKILAHIMFYDEAERAVLREGKVIDRKEFLRIKKKIIKQLGYPQAIELAVKDADQEQ